MLHKSVIAFAFWQSCPYLLAGYMCIKRCSSYTPRVYDKLVVSLYPV